MSGDTSDSLRPALEMLGDTEMEACGPDGCAIDWPTGEPQSASPQSASPQSAPPEPPESTRVDRGAA